MHVAAGQAAVSRDAERPPAQQGHLVDALVDQQLLARELHLARVAGGRAGW